ncbi:hypothetical protein [Mycolicibacterium sp.]|jgi:hypothetical protein|uniref:hypothetical protein n=1 Tax=Mycolicibacterium sp. TaxID=2320850 RepID=UPI00355F3BAA
MVAAVLANPKASRRMTELSDPDRAFLVAGLTAAGVTAQDIADRTGCSLRLVRAIRAQEMTQVCVWALDQSRAADDLLRVEQIDHASTRAELGRERAEVKRLRMQLDQILDELQKSTLSAFPRCGHPKVKWNTGRRVDRSGDAPRVYEYCLECNRLRAAKCRAKKRGPMSS